MIRLLSFVLVLLSGGAAFAQNWQGQTRDDGSYLHGMADFAQGGLTLWCAAPSPQGLDPQNSDANLVEPMASYTLRLLLGEALAGQRGTPSLTAVMWIDGAGFEVPMRVFGEEENMWSADIAMADQTIERLRRARTFTFEVRGGQHWQVGVADLGRKLQEALSHCIFGWQTAGFELPAAFAGQFSTDSRGVQTTVADQNYPQFILTGSVVVRYLEALQAQVNTACGGTGEATNDAWRNQDMDGDGTEDHVFDWNEVRCAIGIPPKCKAAACIVDIRMSSVPNSPVLEVLGKGPRFIPGASGRAELRFDTLLSTCTNADQPETCGPGTLFWNGQALQLR